MYVSLPTRFRDVHPREYIYLSVNMTRYLAIWYLQGGWLTILCAMLSCHVGYIIQYKDYIMQQIYQNLCHKDSHFTFNIPPEGIPPTPPKKKSNETGCAGKI
jgi:hypothetical protein